MPGAPEAAKRRAQPGALMTQDVYMGRRAVDESAAVALEGLFGASTPSDGESGRMLFVIGE